MEILFELTKNIVEFFRNSNKKNVSIVNKITWNYKLKSQNYCRIKETDFVNSSKT